MKNRNKASLIAPKKIKTEVDVDLIYQTKSTASFFTTMRRYKVPYGWVLETTILKDGSSSVSSVFVADATHDEWDKLYPKKQTTILSENLIYLNSETQTLELCLEAVSQNGMNLKLVNEEFKTREVCLAAVDENPEALQFVKNQTERIVLRSVAKDPSCIRFASNPSNSVIMLALENDGLLLQYIKNQTDDIVECALQENENAIVFCTGKRGDSQAKIVLQNVKEKNEMEFQKSLPSEVINLIRDNPLDQTAIKHYNSLILKDIKEKNDMELKKGVTADIMNLIRNNPLDQNAIKHYNTNFALAVEAIKANPWALQYAQVQSKEICLYAVSKIGMTLEYVIDQTPEICLEAINQNPASWKHCRIGKGSSHVEVVDSLKKMINAVKPVSR